MSDAATLSLGQPAEKPDPPTVSVAYLIGAGATQGAIDHANGTVKQLMTALTAALMEQLETLTSATYANSPELRALVNELIDDRANFEHLITFFEDSPSTIGRRFSQDLLDVFARVLRSRLDAVDSELSAQAHGLYTVLLDMHSLNTNPEQLSGIISLNYDTYVERAASELGMEVDLGLPRHQTDTPTVQLLKLHGSLGWSGEWPITQSDDRSDHYWIPPGIRKPKGRYPFNLLWGRALDVLDCDVLRIIGCNLSANDWDLVSLLFSRTFSHRDAKPFDIEVIGRPKRAMQMRDEFPYLSIRSLYELPDVGPDVLLEQTLSREAFQQRTSTDQTDALDAYSEDNSFEYWLIQKANFLQVEGNDLSSPSGRFRRFSDDYSGGS